MIAKRFIGVLVLASVLAPASVEAAAAKLRQIVPPDAFFCVSVDDVGKLRATFEKTSMARFWKDPATQQFTAPLRKLISEGWRELKERQNISDDWHAYLPGEVVFYSEKIRDFAGSGYEMPYCFAARMGLPRERYMTLINKYIAKLPPDARKRQFTAQGVTVRMLEYREEFYVMEPPAMPPSGMTPAPAPVVKTHPAYFQYAFDGDVILLCDSTEATMRGMIRRLKAPPAETVADAPALKRVRSLLPADSQVTGYIALNQLIEVFLRDMKSRAAGQPAMFNPASLGLEGLAGFGMGIHLAEDRFSLSAALDLPSEGRGVVAIIRKVKSSPMATLAVTPATALTYSSMAVDWAGLWNELRATIRSFAPPAEFALAMALPNYENNLGMKIPDVLGALGEEFAYFVTVPPGPSKEPSYVFMVGVKNRPRLKEAIDAIVTLAQANVRVESTDFLGHTIRTIKPTLLPGETPDEMDGEEPFQLSWVLTNDLLAVSASLDSVKQVLQFKAGKRKDSLGMTKLYRDARALLPKKIDSFEVVETGGFIKVFLGQMLAMAKEVGGMREQFGGPPLPFDFSAPFTAEGAARYFGLITQAVQIDAKGFAWVTVLKAPPRQ